MREVGHREVAPRTVETEGRDGADDQARIGLLEFAIELEPPRDIVRGAGINDDVGALRETGERVASARLIDLQGDTFLAEVVAAEAEAVLDAAIGLGEWAEAPRVGACATFELDHFCAERGEQDGGEFAALVATFEDDGSVQG